MERALKKSREKFVSEEDLKESSRGPLTKEIRSYETYISQDGERRNMIRGLTRKKQGNNPVYGTADRRGRRSDPVY